MGGVKETREPQEVGNVQLWEDGVQVGQMARNDGRLQIQKITSIRKVLHTVLIYHLGIKKSNKVGRCHLVEEKTWR